MIEIKTNGSPQALEFAKGMQDLFNREKLWCQSIKHMYDAALPNDGWIEREKNYFTSVNPYFIKQTIAPGSLVRIGFSFEEEYFEAVITRIEKQKPLYCGFCKYHYEKIPDTKLNASFLTRLFQWFDTCKCK